MIDISGLTYIPQYISQTRHDDLLSYIANSPWITDLRRRVQHYGWRYNYTTRRIDVQDYLGPLPDWLQPIAIYLHKSKRFDQIPDQVIINEYTPGQGISRHIDCPPCFGPTIATLSLNSAINFDMYRGEHIKMLRLAPRSILIMTGEARSTWAHGIAARQNDMVDNGIVPRETRYSLTFRTVIRT